MLISDPSSLSTVLGIAAATGVVHTLLGPDHYLPLAAVARERRWTVKQTSLAAIGFGVLHCLASVVLVFGFALTAGSIGVMSSAAAWLMLGIGVCLVLATLRARRVSESTADAVDRRVVTGLIGVAFVIGPCEWLIPVATTTYGSMGALAALQVCGAYSFCTVGMMWAATTVSAVGLARVAPLKSSAFGGVGTGVVCAACGALMLLGF